LIWSGIWIGANPTFTTGTLTHEKAAEQGNTAFWAACSLQPFQASFYIFPYSAPAMLQFREFLPSPRLKALGWVTNLRGKERFSLPEMNTDTSPKRRSRLSVILWILQVLLAALFLFAGITKLILPLEKMAGPIPLPGAFLRFLGVAETLGGLGLILPGILRIKPGLTAVAAACLLIIMIGATVMGLQTGSAVLVPLITGLLLAVVAYARWRVVPLRG